MALASGDLEFAALNGSSYPLRDWLTSYPFLLAAIDPYTHESSWILETAGRLIDHYQPADVRIGWLATTDVDGCKQFLGKWAEEYLVFPDPQRELVKSLGLERLPALVYVRQDGYVEVANGWDPQRWSYVAHGVSKLLAWTKPLVPQPGDPTAFSGTPALDA